MSNYDFNLFQDYQKANKILEAASLKDTDSTVAKRGSVLIGLMTPNGAIWSGYQRAVLMR